MSELLGRRGAETVAAFGAYVALTLAMTWPVAAGLATDVPADLGDSLLVMGLMAWVSEGILAVAGGTMSFADLWNVNFFHPTPLGLTFSEHFIPQAVQGLPVYVATGNIVLAYNVVFLATFVLSGLGTFLFVRELTGSARAALVAGLFYAFFPYRWDNAGHLHTESSQWMPFALYGFRRYFDSGRRTALAGGALAFLVQGLSSGYFLFFFAPVLASYVVWEIVARGRTRQLRPWLDVMVAGAATAIGALPFLLPYAAARAEFGLNRPIEELWGYSADLLTYLHTSPQVHVWGPLLHRFAQPEGGIFPGAAPLAAGIAAVVLWLRRVQLAYATSPSGRFDRLVHGLLVGTALVIGLALVVAMTGGGALDVGGVRLRATSAQRPIEYAVLMLVVAVALSSRLRCAVRHDASDLTPWIVLALVFAVVMSLGPRPRAGGQTLVDHGLYGWFFAHVPGYSGLRVPARFGMVAGCLLAPLAGLALAHLARWRHGAVALVTIGGLFLGEVFAAPLAMNVAWRSTTRFEAPWPVVYPLNQGPLAYRTVLHMPPETVLLELPFGDAGWDLRYVYYAGLHGRRIVNGYSGYFPNGYASRAAALGAAWEDGDRAWRSLTSSGATHVVVHERAYPAGEGAALSGWLESRGARREATFADGDVLLALPVQ